MAAIRRRARRRRRPPGFGFERRNTQGFVLEFSKRSLLLLVEPVHASPQYVFAASVRVSASPDNYRSTRLTGLYEVVDVLRLLFLTRARTAALSAALQAPGHDMKAAQPVAKGGCATPAAVAQ